jgi:hypothetical protein
MLTPFESRLCDLGEILEGNAQTVFDCRAIWQARER